MSVAGTERPAERARRARSKAALQTALSMASSGSSRSKSLNTFLSRSPPAPFHNSNRMMGHQQASPASSARITRSLTAASPFGRSIWIQEEESTRITPNQPFRRCCKSSSTLTRSLQVPACLVSSAMRLRRLNSWMAVTIASRFVFALVNRMASARSLSGILTVVFMIPFYWICIPCQEE